MEVRRVVDIGHGGEFLGGEFLGGEFLGGEFLGGEFLGERYGPGARDQRLGEFGRGRRGGRAGRSGWLASGWLALQVCDVSRPEVLGQATGDELLGIGRAWKSLETWSFTGKLAVVRELILRFPLNKDDEPGPAAGGLPDE